MLSLLFAIIAATATAATMNVKTYSFGEPQNFSVTDQVTGYDSGVPLPDYAFITSGPNEHGIHFAPILIAINFVIYYMACLVIFGVVRVIVKKKH